MAEREDGAGRREKIEGSREAAEHKADSGTASKAERKGSGGMSAGKAVLMITQIGVSMLTPIFVGGLIGHWLDRLTGAGFLFLVFLVFGFLAAFRNAYRLTKPFYADDLRREERELAYWREFEQERAKNRAAAADGMQQPGAAQKGSAEFRLPSSGSGETEIPREIDGVKARRLRAQLAELRRESGCGEETPKDRKQEAEEEFNAWRKRNGGE